MVHRAEPNTARLYFHLLLTANWSRKQWQGITIQPGDRLLTLSTCAYHTANGRFLVVARQID